MCRMKKFTSKSQKIGKIGEDVACKYLMRHGFMILERNFTRKCGEIDIVASKSGKIHFVEVKSVSCGGDNTDFECISRETDGYRPEDQVHVFKQGRLIRTVKIYLAIHDIDDWQFDVLSVFLNHDIKKARVFVVSDVILGN